MALKILRVQLPLLPWFWHYYSGIFCLGVLYKGKLNYVALGVNTIVLWYYPLHANSDLDIFLCHRFQHIPFLT